MQEIWKDIENYEGIYQVSNLGRVRSLNYRNTNKIKLLSVHTNTKGYLDAHLAKNGISHHCVIHRLVAKAFISNPNNLPQVNHIDGNKKNNCINNLEWCNNSQNMKHAYKMGMIHKMIGVNNPKHKAVYQYDLKGNFIKKWEYIQKAADCLNIKQSGITCCCQGIYKTSSGFIWKYADK